MKFKTKAAELGTQAASNTLFVRSDNTSIFPDIANYESRKSVWVQQNPNATSAEYEAAISGIADECGI